MLWQEPGGEEKQTQTDLYSQVRSPLEGVFSVFPVLVKNPRWADGGCCHVTLQEAALRPAALRSEVLGLGRQRWALLASFLGTHSRAFGPEMELLGDLKLCQLEKDPVQLH